MTLHSSFDEPSFSPDEDDDDVELDTIDSCSTPGFAAGYALLSSLEDMANLEGEVATLRNTIRAACMDWMNTNVHLIDPLHSWPLLGALYGTEGLALAVNGPNTTPQAQLLAKAKTLFRETPGTWRLTEDLFNLSDADVGRLLAYGFPLSQFLQRSTCCHRAMTHALTVENSWVLKRWTRRLSLGAAWFQARQSFRLPEAPLTEQGAKALIKGLTDLVQTKKRTKVEQKLFKSYAPDARVWGAILALAHENGTLAAYKQKSLHVSTFNHHNALFLNDEWIFDTQSAHAQLIRTARFSEARSPLDLLLLPRKTQNLEDSLVLFAPAP